MRFYYNILMEDNQLERLYKYLYNKYKNVPQSFHSGNTPSDNISLGLGLCLRAKEYVSDESCIENADLISDCAIYNLLVKLIEADNSVKDEDLEHVAILQFMKSLNFEDYTSNDID